MALKMTKHTIYFEIQGIAMDEAGNPAPAGMCVSADYPVIIPYETLAACVSIPDILESIHLLGVVSSADVRIITKEEYEEKYGDDKDEK